MNKNYNLKLDLQFRCNNQTMKFNQFDNNTSDFFIKISNGGKSFDTKKAMVVLASIKPSGKVSSQFVEVKNDIVYAYLKPSMRDEIGTYTAQAMLILEDERVVTDTINYEVNESKIISSFIEDVEVQEEYTLLTDMLSRLSTIEISEEQRMINEAERILSEENRKIEEAKRVEAELIRVHEEADRAKYDAIRESNENIRKSNEVIRGNNENIRLENEAKRVEEENKRKLAEEERNANYNFMTEDEERRRLEANAHKEAEVLRVQAETDRVNEEAKRRTTEQARVSVENTRVSNENTRKANEENRKANEVERVNAETQRQTRYNTFIVNAEAHANEFKSYTNNAKADEEERKANELDRKAQENRRTSNETERISNENTRKANEVTRQNNETSRQNVFTNKVNEVNNKISEIDKAKSDMTNTVSNKINEVETRFNTLTSKQQQDAEVIDARVDFKGVAFNSLKERIDNIDKILRDSTVSTVETESDFTTVEATSNGYFEDVKLEGKTLVNNVNYDTSNFSTLNATIEDGNVFKLFWSSSENDSNICPKVGTHNYKPNTMYTIVVNILENTAGVKLGISKVNTCIQDCPLGMNFSNLLGISTLPIVIGDMSKTCSRDLYFCSWNKGGDLSKHIKFTYMILEGDHTQNPPSYFEGLMSAGQDIEEVSVESVNENLIKLNSGVVEKNGIAYEFKDDGSIVANGTATGLSEIILPVLGSKIIDMNVFNGKTVSLSGCPKDGGSNKYRLAIVSTEPAWININDIGDGCSCTIDLKDGKEWTIRLTIYSGQTVNNLVFLPKLQFGSNVSVYQTHQSDKKHLLYYNNEAQTWEKPILRQWDSIEKHSDGKYYYHKRSGEVVLDGSESWIKTRGSDVDTTIFEYKLPKYKSTGGLLSDRFNSIKFTLELYRYEIEGIYYNFDTNVSKIAISINNSKLSTQEVESFKAWLQANPTTVVYQLEQEEVYECTNIDLITYADETNYIVNSGAIAPKSTLKLSNSVGNVVNLLKNKISILEDLVNKLIQNK